jgi:hypothetical protein
MKDINKALVPEMVALLRTVVTKHDISRDLYWRRYGLPVPNDDSPEHIRQIRALLVEWDKNNS